MQHFKTNQQLRARDLNQLGDLAQRQALQGPSASTYNNGVGVVMRNPRRPPRRIGDGSINIYPSGASVMAKITGGAEISGYTVRCYPEYPSDNNSFNAAAFIPTIALGSYRIGASDGGWLLVHYAGLTVIGGTN